MCAVAFFSLASLFYHSQSQLVTSHMTKGSSSLKQVGHQKPYFLERGYEGEPPEPPNDRTLVIIVNQGRRPGCGTIMTRRELSEPESIIA